jgi:ABC-type branched-subunit amino acid transport system ATPase component
MVERAFETIEATNEREVTILLVEQDAVMALDIAEDANVHGKRPGRARRPRQGFTR